MADEPKKPGRFDSWKKSGAGSSAQTGASQEIMRRAMEINPELKGDKSTEEFFNAVQTTRKQDEKQKIASANAAPASKPKEISFDPLEPPKTQAVDLARTVAETKQWLTLEVERVKNAAQGAALKQQQLDSEIKKAALDSKNELTNLLRRLDPQLVSPKILAVLQEEARFLKAIGFEAPQVKS